MSRDVQPPVLDFDGDLPAGQQWFPVWKLARHWDVSVPHIVNLINEGLFTHGNIGPVDFSSKSGKPRATTRIPRACVIAFLNAHKL